MKDNKKPSPYSIEMLFLGFFGTGFSPKAPGTVASAATLPFLYFIAYYELPVIFLYPILLLSIIGSGLVAEMFQNKYEVHDPSWIVIDEVIGMFITFCFWPTKNFLELFCLFVLFRIFDIFKPWPVSYFDKEITHGIGTILDDVVAGIYAGGLFYLIRTFVF